MKNLVSVFLVFAAFLLIVPAIGIYKSSNTDTTISAKISNISDPTTYKILDKNSQNISEISPRDYLIGAVFAEIPASFEPEALKTQAILAHTYILRQHLKEKSKPTKNLLGADISNDSSLYQAYFTNEQAKVLYGDKFDELYNKIASAVDSVIDEVITYNDELIIPAFHSMSGGITESAKVAWGKDIPYLQPVSSTEDTKVKGFSEEKTYTPDEIYARLTQGIAGVTLSEDKSTWIKITEKSQSGTVISIKIGNQTVTGAQIQKILTLRSSNFEISFDGTNFKVITKGVGHGVGLSQYGANSMALAGKNYNEIINYYYKDVMINKLNLAE